MLLVQVHLREHFLHNQLDIIYFNFFIGQVSDRLDVSIHEIVGLKVEVKCTGSVRQVVELSWLDECTCCRLRCVRLWFEIVLDEIGSQRRYSVSL